jgi:hypothetical protein
MADIFGDDDLDTTMAHPVLKRVRLGSDQSLNLEIAEQLTNDSIIALNLEGREVTARQIQHDFISYYRLLTDGEEPAFWNKDCIARDNWMQRFLSRYKIQRLVSPKKLVEADIKARLLNWLGTMSWLRENVGASNVCINIDEVPVYALMRTGSSYIAHGQSAETKVRLFHGI